MNSDELIQRLKDAQKRHGIMQVVSVNSCGSGDINCVVVTEAPKTIMYGNAQRTMEIQLVENT